MYVRVCVCMSVSVIAKSKANILMKTPHLKTEKPPEVEFILSNVAPKN